MSAILWLIYLALIVAVIAGWWMMFTKAGEAGWKSIIPIWNIIVLLRMVGREWPWIFLILIPFLGSLILWIMISIDLAKSFGRGSGFAVGLILLPFVFVLILGFGDASYRGPANGGQAQLA